MSVWADRDKNLRTLRLEDTEDLVSGHKTDLGNTVRVTEGNTDLRRSKTLASELADLLNDILGGGLEPRRGGAAIGEGRGRWHTLRSQ